MVVTASRPHPPTGPASISLFQQACSLGCPGMVQLSFGLKRKLPNHHEDRKYYNRNLASILLFPQACPFGYPRMDQLSFGLECKLPLPVYLHRHGSLKLEQGQTASPSYFTGMHISVISFLPQSQDGLAASCPSFSVDDYTIYTCREDIVFLLRTWPSQLTNLARVSKKREWL